MKRLALLIVGTLILSSCTVQRPKALGAQTSLDERLAYLEEVEGAKALEWVKAQNQRSLTVLDADVRFATIQKEVQTILESDDRLNTGAIRGGFLYHFLQDAAHVKGLLRRTPLVAYLQNAPVWEDVLDVDGLAAAEGKSWVYKDLTCLRPDEDLCMVKLSPGGSDAAVYREFSLKTKAFVAGGFELPLAKQNLEWLDADTLLVGSTLLGSVTEAGYPRKVVKWSRGTDLMAAPTVLEGDAKDMGVYPGTVWGGVAPVGYVSRYKDFFHAEHSFLADDGSLLKLPVPETAELHDTVGGSELVVSLADDWNVDGVVYRANSVVTLNWLASTSIGVKPTLVLDPGSKTPVDNVIVTSKRLWIQTLDDVAGKLWQGERAADGKWTLTDAGFPVPGTLTVLSVDRENDRLLVSHEGFTQAPTLFEVRAGASNAKIRQLKSKYQDADFVVDQKKARSKDGTLVNYFVIHNKAMALTGHNPTLLYAYGGFNISSTPSYLASFGKSWLERGGVYVVANIRGGGEYGAEWHKAALKENRQRAYDDFIAVAEDLIATKVTSPRHLGIRGGSNGGLLVGVAMTERPDLFNAVVCEVPLLDMLAYTRFPPGASWIGEYGDPADPAMAEVISKYSPYQNLKADVKYPTPFFITSTKDDRVHPAHARRMAAKMQEFGLSFYYFENTEGGHSASANLQQRAYRSAAVTVYLLKQLADQ